MNIGNLFGKNIKIKTDIEKYMDSGNNSDNFRYKSNPDINVITKEEFEARARKVFELLWRTLSRSFGPFGAPTLIYNHPFSHITKDGFTIMKNLSLNAKETYLDEAIANMASDICGRLNYTVGDGTTSAVVATYSIFNRYIINKEFFQEKSILPRDIVNRFKVIKEDVIKSLNEKIKPIDTNDRKALRDIIAKVVYISSNGDEQITNYIADFYEELGCPGITCMISDDRVTKKRLIEGYKHDSSLMDREYINTDSDTMELGDTDVLIFTKRITLSTYEYILKPLSKECKYRSRHLICIAPDYDDSALHNKIKRELNEEYRATKDINLILTNYRAMGAHNRKTIEDLAVLLNTTPINTEIENNLIDDIKRGNSPVDVFNIDDRGIKGIYRLGYVIDPNTNKDGAIPILEGDKNAEEELKKYNGILINNNDTGFRVGFIHHCNLGLKDSLFSGFEYNENLYNAVLQEAEVDLKEKEKRYTSLGTFSLEVARAQKRLYALKLKMGLIEIGAESELSQKMTKDFVDDAIRAAASAFNHGVVLGCNVNLIQSIFDVLEDAKNENRLIDIKLLEILLSGFCDVYMTVLRNAFPDRVVSSSEEVIDIFKSIKEYTNPDYESNIDTDILDNVIHQMLSTSKDGTLQLYDVIINYSILTSTVFDVSSMLYTNEVINSVETDRQILRATVDLISLLMVGNQVVVTQKHNFED